MQKGIVLLRDKTSLILKQMCITFVCHWIRQKRKGNSKEKMNLTIQRILKIVSDLGSKDKDLQKVTTEMTLILKTRKRKSNNNKSKELTKNYPLSTKEQMKTHLLFCPLMETINTIHMDYNLAKVCQK